MCAKICNNPEAPCILLGEDDKFISKIYKTKLENVGYQVVHAVNGDELLKLARKENPDLIILDLIMPVKDGFETLKELKANPQTQNLKVVVLSNLSQEEDKQRIMELGAEEYLVKAHVSFGQLVDLVKRHIGEK